jgi:hypothetical protein
MGHFNTSLLQENINFICINFVYITDILVKLNLGLLWQKLHSTRRGPFYQNKGLKIGEENSKILHLVHFTAACGAEEGWRKSVGPVM